MVDWKELFEKKHQVRGTKMPEIYSEVCDSKWIIENVKKYNFKNAAEFFLLKFSKCNKICPEERGQEQEFNE